VGQGAHSSLVSTRPRGRLTPFFLPSVRSNNQQPRTRRLHQLGPPRLKLSYYPLIRRAFLRRLRLVSRPPFRRRCSTLLPLPLQPSLSLSSFRAIFIVPLPLYSVRRRAAIGEAFRLQHLLLPSGLERRERKRRVKRPCGLRFFALASRELAKSRVSRGRNGAKSSGRNWEKLGRSWERGRKNPGSWVVLPSTTFDDFGSVHVN